METEINGLKFPVTIKVAKHGESVIAYDVRSLSCLFAS